MVLRFLSILGVWSIAVAFEPMAVAKTASLTDQFFYRKVVAGEVNGHLPSEVAKLEKQILAKLELRGLSDLSLQLHDMGAKEYHAGKANSAFKYLHVKVGNIAGRYWGGFTFDLAFRQEENEFDLGESEFKVARSCNGNIESDGSLKLSIERCLSQVVDSNSH